MDDISRFHELIQPIKDLASSWDIDISEKLEEYLEEIMNFRVGDVGVNGISSEKLNFAEAALLIQGSTTIYSKKVEYLYQLVLKSIEFITNKKSNILKSNDNDPDNDNGISELTSNTNLNSINNLIHFGNDVQYLLLDDLIEEGVNIDIKPTNTSTLPVSSSTGAALSSSFTPSKGNISDGRMNSTTNVSHGANTSRVSISIIHSMMSEEQGIGSLKLTGSCVDHSGALLVNGFAGSAFNSQKRKSLGSLGGNISNIMANNSILLPNLSHLNDQQNLFLNLNNDKEENNLPWNEDLDYFPPNHDEDLGYDDDKQLNLDELYDKKNDILKTPIKNENNKNSAFYYKNLINSSQLLDPHCLISEPKPIKKGRAYRLPPLLILKDKIIKYNNSNKNSDKKLIFPSVFDIFLTHYEKKFSQFKKDIVYFSSKNEENINKNDEDNEKNGNNFLLLSSFSVPLRGLHDLSLLPLLKLKQRLYRKKKLNESKNNKKINKLLIDNYPEHDIISNILTNNKKIKLNPMKSSNVNNYDQLTDNNDQEMMMLYGDEVIDHEYYKEDREGEVRLSRGGDKEEEERKKNINPDEILFNQYISKNNELSSHADGEGKGKREGDDFHSDHFIDNYFNDHNDYDNDYDEELAMRMDKALNEDLLRASAHTYEMICKQYIESFHRGANAYAMETQLSKRVSDWTLRLEPILQAQEDQAPFDIHEYADNFLSKLDEVVKHRRSSLSREDILSLEKLYDEDKKEHQDIDDEDTNEEIDENDGNDENLNEILEVLHDEDFLELDLGNKDQINLMDIKKNQSEKFKILLKTAKNRLKKLNKFFTVSFNDLAQDMNSSEVCRLFLACLQLANFGNVDVKRTIDMEKETAKEESSSINPKIDNSFKLVLLNNKRNLNVEEFLAPSLNNQLNNINDEEDEDLIQFNKMIEEQYKKKKENDEKNEILEDDSSKISVKKNGRGRKRNVTDRKSNEEIENKVEDTIEENENEENDREKEVEQTKKRSTRSSRRK